MKVNATLRVSLASYFAAEDPRCPDPAGHATISKGNACPTCHLSIFEYIDKMPEEWPA